MGCDGCQSKSKPKPDALTCPHWSDCDIVNGGCCALDKYGGHPSHGVCLRICKNNGECVVHKGGILKGAVGLAKAHLGIDAADKETVESRQATCLGCDRFDFGKCKECGCYLHAKVRIKSETCPIGRW